MKNHKLGASVLSIPFLNFKEAYQKIIEAGIDFLHLDIMDGNFVPNLSFSPSIAKEIKALSPELPVDIHFMITSLAYEQTSQAFLSIQPTRVSVHAEVFSSLDEIMKPIKERNIKFGLALNPNTPLDPILTYLPQLDFILLMSVYPGFGGQLFNPIVLEKAKTLDQLRSRYGYTYLLEVDGGLQLSLIPSLAESGVDLFIIGSDLVRQQNPSDYIESFRSLCHPFS